MAAVLVAAAGGALAAAAASPVVGEGGAGRLTLGRTLAALRHEGLVGATTPGCELASPRPLEARLRPPLTGWATFGGDPPHRLQALAIRGGGTTSRGIGVGARSSAVARAYPEARRVDSRPPSPLVYSAYVLRRHGRDRLWFLLDQAGARVAELDVPALQFCE